MRGLMVLALTVAMLAGATVRPARAGTPELRLLLAKLEESLEAGLTRADLRSLRIDIGAEIRLQTLYGTNALANLQEFSHTLTAVDQAWTVLGSAPPCQIENGAVHDPKVCQELVDPLYRALGTTTPDLTAKLNPGTLMTPLLKALKDRADSALRAIM